MATATLRCIEPVDPRQVWASEAGDFTPWLGKLMSGELRVPEAEGLAGAVV